MLQQRDGSSAATATAFSLASIFPRKTEKVLPQEDTTTSTRIVGSNNNNNDAVIKSMYTEVDSTDMEELHQVNNEHNHNRMLYLSQQQRQEIGEATSNANTNMNINANNNDELVVGGNPIPESAHLQLNPMGAAAAPQAEVQEKSQTAEQQIRAMQNSEVRVEDEKQAAAAASPAPEVPKVTQVRVHSYVDTTTVANKRWVALNSSRRKFLAFLDYNNVTLVENQSVATETLSLPEPGTFNNQPKNGAATSEDAAECSIRKEWRELWKARRLLTDRTELLAVYQSDKQDEKTESTPPSSSDEDNDAQTAKRPKRGGFSDLLNLYTHRLVAILNDEQHDEQTPPDERHHSSLVRAQQRNRFGQPVTEDISVQTDHRILIKWLEDHYGVSETRMLQASRFRTLPVPVQLDLLNHFLSWFRNDFPYFYDRCDTCGASQKDDMAAEHARHAAAAAAAEISGITNSDNECQEDHHEYDEEGENDDHATFLGYMYPSEIELKGKASRTELYHCHKCSSFTRFPRFNSAFDIIQAQRGRCGEYSLLLYRFLRALNHDARWVVDWADHVWAEVLIGDNSGTSNGESLPSSSERWVHLDPCEAAVDNPHLYESWGKKQTYIVALYAPLRYQALKQLQANKNKFSFLGSLRNNGNNNSNNDNRNNSSSGSDITAAFSNTKAPLVEDVTQQYTTDSWEDICKRRDEAEGEVESAVANAVEDLQRRLFL